MRPKPTIISRKHDMPRTNNRVQPPGLEQPTRSLDKANQQPRATETNLTTELTKEHRVITQHFEQLRTNTVETENNGSNRKTLYGQLAESLNNHFRREEQLLFPALGLSLGSAICNRLREEHGEITNIATKLSRSDTGSQESCGQLEQLFRAHISTEENVLFWYLDLQQAKQ